MIGLATRDSATSFSGWKLQKPPNASAFSIAADFSDGTVNPFTSQSGTWQMATGVYRGTAAANSTAISTKYIGVAANSTLTLQSNVNVAAGVTGGFVFDYYSSTNYKFAAIVAGSNQVVVGHVSSAGTFVDQTVSTPITAGTNYLLGISLKGASLSVTLNGAEVMTRTYYTVINDGSIGLFSRNGSTTFDNALMQGDDPRYTLQAPATGFATLAVERMEFAFPVLDSGDGTIVQTQEQLEWFVEV